MCGTLHDRVPLVNACVSKEVGTRQFLVGDEECGRTHKAKDELENSQFEALIGRKPWTLEKAVNTMNMGRLMGTVTYIPL